MPERLPHAPPLIGQVVLAGDIVKGGPVEAAALYKEAMERAAACPSLGPGHPNTRTYAGNYARLLAELGRRATPHPYASISQPLSLTGAGDKLPRTLVACTFPLETVRSLMAAGHPWFAGLGDATLVGLATGHWPMFSEPSRLAAALAAI